MATFNAAAWMNSKATSNRKTNVSFAGLKIKLVGAAETITDAALATLAAAQTDVIKVSTVKVLTESGKAGTVSVEATGRDVSAMFKAHASADDVIPFGETDNSAPTVKIAANKPSKDKPEDKPTK